MLPLKHRLKKQKDFDKFFEKSKKFYSKNFIAKIIKNNLETTRFAFVISKKISKKAVVRNKIKRQLSEAVSLYLHKIKPGYDVIIIAKTMPQTLELNFQDIEKQILQIFKTSGLNA